MPDVDGFYRRYIDGRDSLPYEQMFTKAGLVFRRNPVTSLFLGVSAGPSPSGGVLGQAVTPGSAADEGGVEPGDVMSRLRGITISSSLAWGAGLQSRAQS